MQIIIYASPFNAMSRDLMGMIQNTGTPKKHECHHTLESLADRLRQPLVRFDSLLILCPADGYELAGLTAIGHLLRDMQVIVLLPDREARTISNGHMLRPRFLGYSDGDLNDVATVVERMAALNTIAAGRSANT